MNHFFRLVLMVSLFFFFMVVAQAPENGDLIQKKIEEAQKILDQATHNLSQSLLSELGASSQIELAKMFEIKKEQLSEYFQHAFFKRYSNSLKVSSLKDALNIIAGSFQDQENKDKVHQMLMVAGDLNVQFSYIGKYLIRSVQLERNISKGIQLDIVCRILYYELEHEKKALLSDDPKKNQEIMEKANQLLFQEALKQFTFLVINKIQEKEKKIFIKNFGVSEEKLPEKLTQLFKANFPEVFQLSEEKSHQIVAGNYNEVFNKKRLEFSLKTLELLELPLPLIAKEIKAKFLADQIQAGIEMEFSMRVLWLFKRRVEKVVRETKKSRENK